MQKLYNVGIYVRLSIEDTKNRHKVNRNTAADESVSIENQKEILSKHCMKMGWIEKRVYSDDGYGGGDFNRPAFKEMMDDVTNGVINLILVKDLSRFGRNYIEVGRYTDFILPSLNCRFIAYSDDIDTGRDDNDMMHFRSLLNDYYLKDISNKIKAVKTAQAKNGDWLGGFAMYGYKNDHSNKNKLVIDEYASGVVRKIFELRLGRIGYAKIAGILNSEGILSPREYRYQQLGKPSPYKIKGVWLVKAVRVILDNQFYLGHTVLMKTKVESHRTKIAKPQSSDQWVITHNTHEPIIDLDTWNAVHEIDLKNSDPKNNRPKQSSLFQGLLVCADCGGAFTSVGIRWKRVNGDKFQGTAYDCAKYRQTASVLCYNHYIRETTLSDIVLADIKAYAESIKLNENRIISEIQKQLACDNTSRQLEIKNQLKAVGARLAEIDKLTANLYEDKVCGVISETMFGKMIIETETEKSIKKSEQIGLLEEQKKIDLMLGGIDKWIMLIQKHTALQSLDRETLTELVEKIEVGKSELVDGVKRQDIRIFYKYVGAVSK